MVPSDIPSTYFIYESYIRPENKIEIVKYKNKRLDKSLSRSGEA